MPADIAVAEKISNLIDEKDWAKTYESFVNSYNHEREHGGIKGMIQVEKFMKFLNNRY